MFSEIPLILFILLFLGAFIAAWFVTNKIKSYRGEVSLWDYETGLLFQHGRFVRILEPGRSVYWGRGYQVLRFDTRWTEQVVQGQELMTKDKATVKLTVVAVYRVADALKLVQAASNATQTIYTQIQLALRDLVSQQTLEDLLQKKTELGDQLLSQSQPTAETVGLELQTVAIRDLIFGSDLKSAFAEVITARQSALAELEKARGEAASLRTLANAARVFDKNPQVLQLRYLQTLEQMGSAGYGDKTLVLGKPEDWIFQK